MPIKNYLKFTIKKHEWLKWKRQANSSVDGIVDQREILYIHGLCINTLAQYLAVSSKNMSILYDPAISFVQTYPGERHTPNHKKLRTKMCMADL